MRALIVLLVVLGAPGCRKCVRSHAERVRRAAWCTCACANNVPITSFQPETDGLVEVCDEYEERGR